MGRSNDFMFWEERLPVGRGRCEDESTESQVGVSSPPLWRRGRAELRPETTTLLPQNHQHSSLSPTSRLRVILDGRRELMEMIKDMPESSYELTLKDIVDQQDEQEKEEEEVEESEKHKRVNRIPKSNNTKQICRSESMESQVFLLKMFLPVSLTSNKKKTKNKKADRDGPEKEANKRWWKIIFVAIRLRVTHKNANLITNPSSEKKYKSKGPRGCLF